MMITGSAFGERLSFHIYSLMLLKQCYCIPEKKKKNHKHTIPCLLKHLY